MTQGQPGVGAAYANVCKFGVDGIFLRKRTQDRFSGVRFHCGEELESVPEKKQGEQEQQGAQKAHNPQICLSR
ncbi:MAG TPA: hypothetical protein PKW60_13870, partial [Candidatus Hydrogenedentes bacterium]|nr:hypothetical protein [Candidatus Hydrogenedentota bacterium]